MNAVEYAERATLGALLLDPVHLDNVRNWLEADDFADPRNRIVYAVMLDLNASGRDCDPAAVLARLIEDRRACRNNATGAYLAELIDAVPEPSRAAVYGRMVLEASIHRAVRADAVRLGQVAVPTPDPAHTIELIDRQVQHSLVHLDHLERRWSTAVVTDQPNEPVPYLPADPCPTTGNAEAEIAAIGALLRRPIALSDLRQWLFPHDFSEPGCRAAYQVMIALTDSGIPVDAVTVSWRLLSDVDSARSAEHLAAALADGGAQPAQAAGRDVLAAAILDRTARRARELETATRGLKRGVPQLVNVSRRRLASVANDTARLDRLGRPRRALSGEYART